MMINRGVHCEPLNRNELQESKPDVEFQLFSYYQRVYGIWNNKMFVLIINRVTICQLEGQ